MGSAIGSFVAGEMNRDIAEINNKANAQLNAQSWLEQKQENALDRYFQSNESQKAFDRNVEQWMRENQYNAPVEQMKRLQDAGINPTLGLLSNVSMPAANSPQMVAAKGSNASLSSPIPMQPQAAFAPFDIASDMKQMSEAVRNIADARKSGAETKSIESTLSSLVKKMENEAEMYEFQTWLNKTFGVRRYNAETDRIVEETFKATSEALLAAKKGDEAEANKQMLIALKGLHTKEADLKQKDIDSYDTLLQHRIDNILSDTIANEATAENQRAQANYSRDLLKNNAEQRKVFANEVLNAIETRKSIQLSNKQREQMMPLVIKSLEKSIRQQGQDYWNPFRYAGTLLGGATSGTASQLLKYLE